MITSLYEVMLSMLSIKLSAVRFTVVHRATWFDIHDIIIESGLGYSLTIHTRIRKSVGDIMRELSVVYEIPSSVLTLCLEDMRITNMDRLAKILSLDVGSGCMLKCYC